ncbi:META domain-containing protein [Kribbella sp. NPDC004536]|uniref:META domain-containing protein n=1 Tax=Kribbella sp. NPDC004536 TaxID=3364106 RepID=UPI0036A73717
MSIMDLPPFNRAQLHAIEVLRGGGAVVVTSPSPMTYGVVARDPRAVNLLKGRPVDHPVAISVHFRTAHDQLFQYLELATDARAMVDHALADRMLVSAPIRPDPAMPEWLVPAIEDGWVLFFDGAWAPLWTLWGSFPFLYWDGTDNPPVATASEARALFPAGTVVIDADDRRTPASTYGPRTVIRVDTDGRPTVQRTGIQDQEAGPALLDRLREFKSAVAVLDGPGRTPLGKTYVSTAVFEDDEPKELVPRTRIQVEFARDPNKNEGGPNVLDVVSADVGCNHLGTAVAAGELLTGGRLSIPGLGGTQVGCQGPLRDQEEWFKTFLTSTPSWRLDGDELTLTSGGTTITLLDRKLAEPDLPLDGIRWKVMTTITNADMRQGFRFSGQAWLSFDNGRVSGWTGCNELSGTYTRNNTELSFSNVTITDTPCPPDTEAFRTTIRTTLGPATTYTITHNKLILLSPSGTGLDLTAE